MDGEGKSVSDDLEILLLKYIVDVLAIFEGICFCRKVKKFAEAKIPFCLTFQRISGEKSNKNFFRPLHSKRISWTKKNHSLLASKFFLPKFLSLLSYFLKFSSKTSKTVLSKWLFNIRRTEIDAGRTNKVGSQFKWDKWLRRKIFFKKILEARQSKPK